MARMGMKIPSPLATLRRQSDQAINRGERSRIIQVNAPNLIPHYSFLIDVRLSDRYRIILRRDSNCIGNGCVQAKSLRTISTPIFVPAQVTILPEALPLSLERFCAPLHTAHLVAGVRRLKALGLLRCGVGTREGIVVLASVHEGLKMLYVELTGWDGEVLSAAAQLFKKLRRLKIVYDGPNGPGEVRTPCS